MAQTNPSGRAQGAEAQIGPEPEGRIATVAWGTDVVGREGMIRLHLQGCSRQNRHGVFSSSVGSTLDVSDQEDRWLAISGLSA